MTIALKAPLFMAMERRLPGLSKNHRRLARHIAAHYQTVAFSTISELARASGVSEATIVRFCRALDFAGYPAFQGEVRRLVRADLKGTERFSRTRPSAPKHPAPLAPVIEKELENIEGLQRSFDRAAFDKAVKAIAGAAEVIVAGSRSTASLAAHLWFGLSKIGIAAERVLAVSSEVYDRLVRAGPDTLLVLLSYPRYLTEHIELQAFAKKRRLRTLLLTDSAFAPLKGDITLAAPAESASFVAFHAAPMILINALLSELSLADPDATLAALSRFEALAEERGYFHREATQ